MEKIKENRYLIVQGILLVLLLIYIGMIFSMKSGSNQAFSKVAKKLEKNLQTEKLVKANAQEMKRFYGLNVKDYEGGMLYKTSSAIQVDEILLLKAKSNEQAEETLDLIQKRIDRQIKTFEGYGAEQTKLLKDAVLEVRGKFVFFAVSPKADELEKVFRESL